MASAIVKKYALNAKGVLYIENDTVLLENPDTGEAIPLQKLLEDFESRYVKLSVNFDEEYVSPPSKDEN